VRVISDEGEKERRRGKEEERERVMRRGSARWSRVLGFGRIAGIAMRKQKQALIAIALASE
jgi:hypothetical protein